MQIKVDEDEIARRINKFIENKRDEINRSNIQDFIETKAEDDSCARVNSVVFRIKDSKGHLKGEFFGKTICESKDNVYNESGFSQDLKNIYL